MRLIALALTFGALVVGCGGETPLNERKPDGMECSDSTECASGYCGTAEIQPFTGACMRDPAAK
jgi:hypothetical protein